MFSRHVVVQVTANALIVLAVLVFATGFFPYKPFIPGLARHEDVGFGSPPEARFNKIIFMVVDALRSDFVFSERSGFEFTQSLIRDGSAIPFTAHATSPTITMPRVKAITTGSIPSFLDVILNFAESDTTSTLANQDTWLAQIRAKDDGKLVMYGDDTWLKLFPNLFMRSDGTSSFFVSDFTEVDNNVTRHVPHELRRDDWDAMILHYLGLDHIGHKTGPLGPNMLPKQTEMDGIVRQIYEAMSTEAHHEKTLLILCGDHGMNDAGNHGGSAPGETSPALVFISPRLTALSSAQPCPAQPDRDFQYYKLIEQSDVAPTIAGLFGTPVPLNNLGVFIEDFLSLWPGDSDKLHMLLLNALQMLNIAKAAFPGEAFDGSTLDLECEHLPAGAELACLWSQATGTISAFETNSTDNRSLQAAIEAAYKFCRRTQEIMSTAASNYDVPRLFLGIILVTAAAILTLVSQWPLMSIHSTALVYFALSLILHSVMMFASSYVEEEQHFWYWVTSGWVALLRVVKLQEDARQKVDRYVQIPILILLAAHRIVQRWNQTGQKHAGAPDIVHDHLIPDPQLLWLLVFATYAVVAFRIGRCFAKHMRAGLALGSSCAVMLCVPAFVFKLAFTANDAPELVSWLSADTIAALQQFPLVGTARLIFLTLGLDIGWAIASRRYPRHERISGPALVSTLHELLTLFLLTQTRAHNIPLYMLFLAEYHALRALRALRLTAAQVTLTTLLLTHASFFALGNSNAISSIDLSNAYNGVAGYNVLAVGLLVFASNWAAPIWWSVAGTALLIDCAIQGQPPAPTTSSSCAQPPAAGVTDSKKKLPSASASAAVPRKRPWIAAEHRHLASLVAGSVTAPPPPPDGLSQQRPRFFAAHAALHTLFASGALAAVMLACTLLRTHLFIWTVFSPKYLYAMAWSLGFHVLVTSALGAVLWRVGMLGD